MKSKYPDILERIEPEKARIGNEFPIKTRCMNCNSLLSIEYKDVKFADMNDGITIAADYFYFDCPVCKPSASNVNTQINDMLSEETVRHYHKTRYDRGRKFWFTILYICIGVLTSIMIYSFVFPRSP